MLSKISLKDIEGGFNLIDIGCSGNLDAKWKSINRLINLYGFDPNKEECERLNSLAHDFHSAKYLPFAIGDKDEQRILFKTESISCYSLLEPNIEWLNRFVFDNLFHVTGSEKVPTRKLSSIPELQNLEVDIIKVDSQGLDLAILANSGPIIDSTIYIESEPGFTENYIGENTYAQIDSFLRNNCFLLFDLELRRMARKNIIGENRQEKAQLLWCESIWLKDYIQLERKNGLKDLTRSKALKSLLLCGLVGCFDFGYELAELYHRKSLLSQDELTELRSLDGWVIAKDDEDKVPAFFPELVDLAVRLFPGKYRRAVVRSVNQAASKPHLLRSILDKYK